MYTTDLLRRIYFNEHFKDLERLKETFFNLGWTPADLLTLGGGREPSWEQIAEQIATERTRRGIAVVGMAPLSTDPGLSNRPHTVRLSFQRQRMQLAAQQAPATDLRAGVAQPTPVSVQRPAIRLSGTTVATTSSTISAVIPVFSDTPTAAPPPAMPAPVPAAAPTVAPASPLLRDLARLQHYFSTQPQLETALPADAQKLFRDYVKAFLVLVEEAAANSPEARDSERNAGSLWGNLPMPA